LRGAVTPLPLYAFMAWCLVNHRDKRPIWVLSTHCEGPYCGPDLETCCPVRPSRL